VIAYTPASRRSRKGQPTMGEIHLTALASGTG